MNKKRLTATVGAMALTGLLAVAGTFAFLQQVTETKHNVFTSTKDINPNLEEEFDEEDAKNYYPGQVINKKPVMINNSEEGNDIYVAVKLDYVGNEDTNMTKEEFISKYVEIEGFNDNWKLIGKATDGSEVYMYHVKLLAGETSAPIFTGTRVLTGISEVIKDKYKTTIIKDVDGNVIDKTTVKSSSSTVYYDENGDKIEGGIFTLPKFEIAVQGLAVQAEGVDEGTAETQLLALATENGFLNKAK